MADTCVSRALRPHSPPERWLGARTLLLTTIVASLLMFSLVIETQSAPAQKSVKLEHPSSPALSPRRASPLENAVRLGGGKVSGHEWGVFLYPKEDPSEGRKVCVLSASTTRDTPIGGESVQISSPSCHSIGDGAFWRMTTGSVVDSELQILAFVFGPGAQRAELVQTSGRSQAIQLKKLDEASSRRIGATGLTFAVLHESPAKCYERLRVYGRHGRQIGGTPLAQCTVME